MHIFHLSYHFQLMLAEKLYPTTEKLLCRLQDDNSDFPIEGKTNLWRWMKRLGYEYKATSKISIPLDSIGCMSQRAKYFRILDEIRSDGTFIYYHDETWANAGEEKAFVWVDPNTGSGRLKKNDMRGKDRPQKSE